jgi:aminopeptidase N
VQAARPTAEDKEAVWARLADRTVPVSSVGQVGTAFWRPQQDDVLRPYAERFLEVLPRLAEGGMIPGMSYTIRLFPLFAIGEDYFARAESAGRAAPPVVRQTLASRADEVRRMLASRATSAPAR